MIRQLLIFSLTFLLKLVLGKRIKEDVASKSPFEIQADKHFEILLKRLSTFPLKEAVGNNNKERRRRNLSAHLNNDESSSSSSSSHHNNTNTTTTWSKWTIQGKTKPMFVCPGCLSGLQDEQQQIVDTLQEIYPNMRVLAQTYRIFNGIFIEIPSTTDDDGTATTPITVDILPDFIERVLPQSQYKIDRANMNADYIGARKYNNPPYCYQGDGMKVGVLDTGIDYTHEAFGGAGTVLDYQLAFGLGSTDPANTRRDGYFPTSRVVDGIDYLGEDPINFVPDDDPIDAIGHGTAVASAILAVAPNASLVAIKACNGEECPDFAIVLGIEYLLDPNFDGNTDDRADVINLSLGSAFDSAYYDVVAFSLELANFFGAVVTTSVGNFGNAPYSAGAIGSSPNTISVGATNAGGDRTEEGEGGDDNNNNGNRYMESFSSRGPGDANFLKPDLAAPGDSIVAMAGSGSLTRRMQGTSFSAPLVAGAAVLLRQKCPVCSPFAIRSILMNTADRNVRYSETDQITYAPISRMGSGEINIDRAMETSIWAYSVDDWQPSIMLGLVDAHVNLRYTRQILIYSLSAEPQLIRLSSEFRSQAKQESGAVEINFDWTEVVLEGCNDEGDDGTGDPQQLNAIVANIEILIYADKAPVNRMTTAGRRGYDPEMLDRHEFDGHIVFSASSLSTPSDDTEKEIAIPFHMILRQAASPILGNDARLPIRGFINRNFTIINEGAGVAQIDAYDLIYASPDAPEPEYGQVGTSADIRTIGYRTLPVGRPDCDYMVEFNFQTWERARHVGLFTIRANIFVNATLPPITMWIPPIPGFSETYIVGADGINHCTGLSSDHSSNSANTIMRACSNDLGLEANTTFWARFQTDTYPTRETVSWLSGLVKLAYPIPKLRATSYDINPFETFDGINVLGEIDEDAYGIQFVTNAFRDFNRTGAATATTETINVVKHGIILQREVTPDIFIWPGDENLQGPQCESWMIPPSGTCTLISASSSQVSNPDDMIDAESSSFSENTVPLQDDETAFPGEPPACAPVEVPRLAVPTIPPTESPSSSPTAPTAAPSPSPSKKPLLHEVANPTKQPSTDAPSSSMPIVEPNVSKASRQHIGFLNLCVIALWSASYAFG